MVWIIAPTSAAATKSSGRRELFPILNSKPKATNERIGHMSEIMRSTIKFEGKDVKEIKDTPKTSSTLKTKAMKCFFESSRV